VGAGRVGADAAPAPSTPPHKQGTDEPATHTEMTPITSLQETEAAAAGDDDSSEVSRASTPPERLPKGSRAADLADELYREDGLGSANGGSVSADGSDGSDGLLLVEEVVGEQRKSAVEPLRPASLPASVAPGLQQRAVLGGIMGQELRPTSSASDASAFQLTDYLRGTVPTQQYQLSPALQSKMQALAAHRRSLQPMTHPTPPQWPSPARGSERLMQAASMPALPQAAAQTRVSMNQSPMSCKVLAQTQEQLRDDEVNSETSSARGGSRRPRIAAPEGE